MKNPKNWDPSFVEFVEFCLNKCPKSRPSAEGVLKSNKAFFAQAKDKCYLARNLLKDIPTVQERVKLI